MAEETFEDRLYESWQDNCKDLRSRLLEKYGLTGIGFIDYIKHGAMASILQDRFDAEYERELKDTNDAYDRAKYATDPERFGNW